MKPDGGPAFPFPYPAASDAAIYGMSLRDYFAAAALTGFVKDALVILDAGEGDPPWFSTHAGPTAVAAYQYADAMLKERAK